MNRRGQVDWALEHARLNKTQDRLLRLLARRCDNDTGLVPPGVRYTPSVRGFAERMGVSERTVLRALAWAEGARWWVPNPEERRAGRIAGWLVVPDDLMIPPLGRVMVCQNDACGKPLVRRNAGTKWCSDRCRKASGRQKAGHAPTKSRTCARQKPGQCPAKMSDAQ